MRLGSIVMIALLLVLIGAGTVQTKSLHQAANTPETALKSFFAQVKVKHWDDAFAMVQPGPGVEKDSFIKDFGGNNESLKTISALQDVKTKVIRESGNE